MRLRDCTPLLDMGVFVFLRRARSSFASAPWEARLGSKAAVNLHETLAFAYWELNHGGIGASGQR